MMRQEQQKCGDNGPGKGLWIPPIRAEVSQDQIIELEEWKRFLERNLDKIVELLDRLRDTTQ